MSIADQILNPLDGKREQIIEVFVKYYGEEFREQITTRVNNTTAFVAYNQETLNKFIDQTHELGIEQRKQLLETIVGELKKPKGYTNWVFNQVIKDWFADRFVGLSDEKILAICNQMHTISIMGKSELQSEISKNTPFALTAIDTFKSIGLDITNPKVLESDFFYEIFYGKVKTLSQSVEEGYKNSDLSQESFNSFYLYQILNMPDEARQKIIKGMRDFGSQVKNNTAAYASYYIDTAGVLQTFCVFGLSADSSTILHELGHDIQYTTTESGKVKVGLMRDGQSSRFNECLNEFFTIEIYTKYGGKELGLGHDLSLSFSCEYWKEIPLLRPLINKFKDQLKHAIMSNNENEVIQLLGKENYYELLSIINEFKDLDGAKQWFKEKTEKGYGLADLSEACFKVTNQTDLLPKDPKVLECFERAAHLYAQLGIQLQTGQNSKEGQEIAR